MSKYNSWWAEFTPTTGIVTLHDRRLLGDIMLLGNKAKRYRKYMGSKEDAIRFVKSFNKRLDKRYEVRFFTSAQFGLAKEKDGYAIPFTSKQLEEVYYIGQSKI